MGSLLPVSNQLYLSMTYTRDKLANDVDCLGQVSADLSAWFSGPGYARVEQTVDLGSLEQVTVRDLAPVAGTPRHFMRLRLQRASNPP
jgi:hypothetical protein